MGSSRPSPPRRRSFSLSSSFPAACARAAAAAAARAPSLACVAVLVDSTTDGVAWRHGRQLSKRGRKEEEEGEEELRENQQGHGRVEGRSGCARAEGERRLLPSRLHVFGLGGRSARAGALSFAASEDTFPSEERTHFCFPHALAQARRVAFVDAERSRPTRPALGASFWPS